jgi:hypothetical protein
MFLAGRRLSLGLFLAGLLLICPRAAGEPRPPERHSAEADVQARAKQLREGMTAEGVRDLLGPPKRVARQILYARYVEQWTYDDPPVRIEFDWRKGQEKRIQTVQLLTTPPRPDR